MSQMTERCPQCGAAIEGDDRFCVECGRPLTAEAAPAAAAAATAENIRVEVETDRPHLQNHRSQLRFRLTAAALCRVTLRVLLHGRGEDVDQDPDETEQTCRFQNAGEPFILSFPFRPRVPGDIQVDRLRMTVTPDAGQPLVYELPDQSLFVHVCDPALRESAPGVTINVQKMVASDIRPTINVDRQETWQPPAETGWTAIQLRELDAEAIRSLLPAELRLALPGGLHLDLVRIPAGRFTMGSLAPAGRGDEQPAHPVRITRDFYLARFPITQGQYESVVAANPSKFPGRRHPVDCISWTDARDFCRKLRSHLTHHPDALGGAPVTVDDVTLPTEAEWEYACRAGTDTAYSFGDDRALLPDHGWFDRSAKSADRTTHPVGEFKPNPWNLFDMHGQLWEWCADFWSPDYSWSDTDSEAADPPGPPTGDRRVLRGGSWSYYAKHCRSASRHAAGENDRTPNYGLRIALRAHAADERTV